MKGNVDLDRGTYKITIQDIFTKEFNITKGSSLLFNGDPFYATLDLKTKYLVPSASLSALTTEGTSRKSVKVNCLMDITGTLASPILKFDLELPEGSEEEKEILAEAGVEIPEEILVEAEAAEVEVETEGEYEEAYAAESEEETKEV